MSVRALDDVAAYAARSLGITPTSLPATSSVALSGASPVGDAKPRSHGRREDSTDCSHDAASAVRDHSYAPFGAIWNVKPGEADPCTPACRVEIAADIIVDQLTKLVNYINERRDVLSLRDVAEAMGRIDDARRISLHGLVDTPLTEKGRLLDARV